MTDHKHLKRRVRERMARTGESYTTALRHVAGRAPATTTSRRCCATCWAAACPRPCCSGWAAASGSCTSCSSTPATRPC
ncbi:hypothetical protein ACFQ0B_69570 [Nonomuraea thailandensis]